MSTKSVRLNKALVDTAESESLLLKRSTPKQIEYWCQLGQLVAHALPEGELLALSQGFTSIHTSKKQAAALDPDELFNEVEHVSRSGQLATELKIGRVYFEASTSTLGMLDRVEPNGTRTTGTFQNGQFTQQPSRHHT